MEEAEFWGRLEMRICLEFRGFPERWLRHYWCDGLMSHEYELSGPERRIRGAAWCGAFPDEKLWEFTLILGPGIDRRESIDWASLLPGEWTTGWLDPDPRRRHLLIDPLAGHPAEGYL